MPKLQMANLGKKRFVGSSFVSARGAILPAQQMRALWLSRFRDPIDRRMLLSPPNDRFRELAVGAARPIYTHFSPFRSAWLERKAAADRPAIPPIPDLHYAARRIIVPAPAAPKDCNDADY
jgi:hypothetical protein